MKQVFKVLGAMLLVWCITRGVQAYFLYHNASVAVDAYFANPDDPIAKTNYIVAMTPVCDLYFSYPKGQTSDGDIACKDFKK